MDNGLFATYTNIFFIPMDDFGVRLLRIITVPNWPERIMKGLFKPEVRSYGRGSFTYDAYDNGVYFLSFLDGDLWRLFRFREAILDREGSFRVVCFQEQIPFLKTTGVGFVVIQMDKGGKLRTDPHRHILKYRRSGCVGLQFYRLLIRYAEFFRIFRCKMDVAFGHNDTLI